MDEFMRETMRQRRPVTYSPTPTEPYTGCLRVLLVGGDADTENLAECLRCDGHQVHVAPSSDGAVRAARSHPPDVVFLAGEASGVNAEDLIDWLTDPLADKRPFFIHVTDGAAGPVAARSDLHLPRPVPWGWLQHLLKRFQSILMPDACVEVQEAEDSLLEPVTV